MTQPVNVIIKSWNRPLYLWPSLDSFFRYTHYPARFHLIDNASSDPDTRRVIDGFSRRGMFETVEFAAENKLDNQDALYGKIARDDDRYLVLVDGDVLVEPSTPCWLSQFIALAEAHPRLAMIGSYIDQSDFSSLDTARRLYPDLPAEQHDFLVKARSLERSLPAPVGALTRPNHNPPGRFTLLRVDAIRQCGLRSGGQRFYRAVKDAGWDTAIANGVRHRHLSLLNIYDYPDYDISARNTYFGADR
ncbi:MAG: glycosyltransferase family A protein [Hyphomonadaceae bacterium]|nr:glycosyltransferase family A protein [Hyphomonadaceae bacterium]